MKYVTKDEILTSRQGTEKRYQPVINDPVMFAFECAIRHWGLILFSVFSAILLGALYIYFATPVFTAKSTVALDTQRAAPYSLQSDGVENLFIDTQFEELRSDKSLLSVVDTSKLWETPQFNAAKIKNSNNLISKFFPKVLARHWSSPHKNNQTNADAKLNFDRHRIHILNHLRDWHKVVRVGKSYLAEIYFTTPDPKLSARLANTLADVYLADRNDRLVHSSKWIQKRTEAIGKRMQEAFRAVENFKLENNVVLDNEGKLTGERELEALSGMRDLISAEALEMESRLRDLKASLGYPLSGEPVVMERLLEAASFKNPALMELKQRLKSVIENVSVPEKLDVEAEFAKAPRKSELIEIHRGLRKEIKKYIADYEKAAEETRGRRDRIEQRFSRVFEQTNAARQTLAKLRELETQGEILKTLYSSYLNRQIQNIEQTVFPISQARIMSRAVTPVERSSPKTGIVMLLSTLTGAILGLGAALLIDYRRSAVITRPRMLENEFGPLPISSMPMLGHLRGVDSLQSYQSVCDKNSVRKAQAPANDSLLSIKLAIDGYKSEKSRPTVVGVCSAKTGQGASLLAYNLAEFTSIESVRTLLIDADSHRRTLTKCLIPEGGPGLADALIDASNLEQYTVRLTENMDFLAAPTSGDLNFPARLVASNEMKTLLYSVKATYDYIFVDLPSILDHSETQFSVRSIDKYVLNIEYGQTTLEDVAECIKILNNAGEKIARVVINKSSIV